MNHVPDWIMKARGHWQHRGQARPSFAHPTDDGQESVWDYPRPPRIETDTRHVVVRWDDVTIAESMRAKRVLETASAPTFYIPPQDVRLNLLARRQGGSMCEWKGQASYWSLVLPDGKVVRDVAWSYHEPFAEFEPIAGYFSFYPARVHCYVAGTQAHAQPGGLYGGWVTPEVVGPFKGEPGTENW